MNPTDGESTSSDSKMPADDDWSNISDVASRKRIQNRIAQRTYRNNQKRRIEQLEYHAMIARLSQNPASYDMAWRNLTGSSSVTSLLPPGQLLPYPAFNSPNGYNHDAPQTQYSQKPEYLGLDTSSYRSGMNKKRKSSSLNHLPPSNSSTISSSDTDKNEEKTQETTHSNSVVFPEVVESKNQAPTPGIIEDSSAHVFDHTSAMGQDFDYDDDWYESTLPSMTRQGDFMLRNKGEDAVTGELENKPEKQPLKPSDWKSQHPQEGTSSSPVSSNIESQHNITGASRNILPANASMKQRFAYVSLSAKSAGFDSLETLISSYYTSNFQDTPALANTQRLDRNRRLPRLLAEICDNMSTWSSWEAQGFKEEILRVAETTFLKELDGLITMPELQGFLTSASETGLKNTQDNRTSRDDLILKIESIFQSEVPNLWAFVNIMTTNINPSSCATEKDRAHTAFAIISLLYHSRTGTDFPIENLMKSCLRNE